MHYFCANSENSLLFLSKFLKMTTNERADLIQILHASQANLLAKIAPVSEELFLYKPNHQAWSMAELVEHLAITDQSLLAAIIKKGERLYDEMPVLFPNEKLIKAIGNRSRKIVAPDYLVPSGRFKSKQAAIEGFKKSRATVEDFVTTTTLPLEKIAFKHFVLGQIDGIGWIKFMAGHCHRHVEQMNEILEAWNLEN